MRRGLELALQAHHAKKSFERAYDYPVWKLCARLSPNMIAEFNL